MKNGDIVFETMLLGVLKLIAINNTDSLGKEYCYIHTFSNEINTIVVS